jgi:hypothetical protein
MPIYGICTAFLSREAAFFTDFQKFSVRRDHMPSRLAHPLLILQIMDSMTATTLRLLRRSARREAACYRYGLPWT